MKALIPTRVAEMLFALAMGTFGVLHFMHADMMGGMVPSFMPGEGKIWIYVTGAGLVAAAIAILINKYKTMACYLLAAMLLVFVFTLHLKPAMDGNLGNLLKDTGLAMAAIIIGNSGSK
ncbi:MAG: DoxX family protein [Chitinophagaceae bacterium]|nr:DoxX family protein [Chitinophagaceae bacterium]